MKTKQEIIERRLDWIKKFIVKDNEKDEEARDLISCIIAELEWILNGEVEDE